MRIKNRKKEKKEKREDTLTQRYRLHMEKMLEDLPDLSVTELADSFSKANGALLKLRGEAICMAYLRRLGGDLLRRRAGVGAGDGDDDEQSNPLQMPLGFGDIRVPAAITYISMANQERCCLTKKADWHKLESHDFIIRQQYRYIGGSVRDFESFMKLMKPIMKDHPEVTVERALDRLRAEDPEEDSAA